MTNKEAIGYLKEAQSHIDLEMGGYTQEMYDALDLAIKALENERPTGEWIIVDDCEHFIAKCSVCGRIEDSRMVQNYPFCRCGAEMKEKENDGRM